MTTSGRRPTRAGGDFSGRILARLPKALHAELTDVAQGQGTSVNQLIVYLLSRGIGDSSGKSARYVKTIAAPKAKKARAKKTPTRPLRKASTPRRR